MQETRSNCFEWTERITTHHQAKTGKHDSRNTTVTNRATTQDIPKPQLYDMNTDVLHSNDCLFKSRKFLNQELRKIHSITPII